MLRRIYHISFPALVRNLLPIRKRKPRIFALLMCMIAPLERLHSEFRAWALTAIYRIGHTGQVIFLEKVLNDIWGTDYDPADHDNTKQIYITDGERPGRQYIYLDAEEQPAYLGGMAIRTEAEYLSLYSDFIVHVPSGILFNEARMRALINRYMLAGKLYEIRTV